MPWTRPSPISTPRVNPRPAGIPQRVFLTVFFGLFLLVGLMVTWAALRQTARDLSTWRWVETPAEVIAASVAEDPAHGRYAADVAYRYLADGRAHVLRTRRLHDGGSASYASAQRASDAYASGSRTVCYVNPQNPDEAVLERTPPLGALLVLFPMLFVAVGAGGIALVWKGLPNSAAPVHVESRRAPLALFAVFALVVGGIGSWAMLARPVTGMMAARSWVVTPCTIASSQVLSHRGSKSTTYSVEIVYAYEAAGRAWKSNRYDFLGGSSSGYDGKQDIVSRYAPGSRAVCFVNPKDPAEAVLDRSFRPIYLIGLIPLAVFLAGIAVAARLPTIGTAVQGAPRPPIPFESMSPAARFGGAAFFALFWNGTVSVFLGEVVSQWRHGHAPIGLSVFLIPFVLVGALALGFAIHQFLALFNPRPRVTLSSRSVRPGEAVQVDWEIPGHAERIEKLTIRAEGRKESPQAPGTHGSRPREIFARIPVAETSSAAGAARGSAMLRVPADALPTSRDTVPAISWWLVLEGSIPRWPDVKQEVEVRVAAGDPTIRVA